MKILYAVIILLFALPCFADEPVGKVYTDSDLKPYTNSDLRAKPSSRNNSPSPLNRQQSAEFREKVEDLKYPLSHSPDTSNVPPTNQSINKIEPRANGIGAQLPRSSSANSVQPSKKTVSVLGSFLSPVIASIWKLVVFILVLYGLILLIKIKLKNKRNYTRDSYKLDLPGSEGRLKEFSKPKKKSYTGGLS